MEQELIKVREVIKKLIPILREEEAFWKGNRSLGIIDKGLTVVNFVNMSCNHAFDDFPEKFGIEKLEAHQVRGWIMNNSHSNFEQSMANYREAFADLGFDPAE